MFCKKCGKKITDDANYCPYCGAYLIDNNVNSNNIDDPRVSNSSLFHTVNNPNVINPINNKPSSFKRVISILSTIGSIIGLILVILIFIKIPFISDLISFESKNYPRILAIDIPIIILLFINTGINFFFLLIIIKNKIKLFRMLPFRIISIVLSISALILEIIALGSYKPNQTSPVILVALGVTLVAIVVSWTSSMLNGRLKLFIK